MNSSNNSSLSKRSQPLAPLDPRKFSLNIGLIKITTTRKKAKLVELPASIFFEPSENRVEEHLRQILNLAPFEKILIESLQPEIKNRQWLVPNAFKRRLKKLLENVRKLLASPNCMLDSDLEDLLLNLERQMEKEEENNELLDQYRLMILMG